MSVSLSEIVNATNQYLSADHFKDYCPNGLQVEGSQTVNVLVSGVTASQALIDAAIEKSADMIVVHHGYFWKGEPPTIVGIKQRRIASLLENNISLLAYHLPLDAHPELGNNAQLAKLLGVKVTGPMYPEDRNAVGNVGELPSQMSIADFGEHVGSVLGRTPTLIEGGNHAIKTVAWCTGAAQQFIDQAAALGVDAYLSGEISEPTVHSAREHGLHYIAAGHHATERYGVKALGEWMAQEFNLEHHFIDCDNPA